MPQEITLEKLAQVVADGFVRVDASIEELTSSTTKNFARVDASIEELARLTANGFANTATKDDIKRLEGDIKHLDQRLDIVETKLDRALYHDLDLHEKWIKQLAVKVGVDLVRA